MHYSGDAFSTNGKPTIIDRSTNQQVPYNRRITQSDFDLVLNSRKHSVQNLYVYSVESHVPLWLNTNANARYVSFFFGSEMKLQTSTNDII